MMVSELPRPSYNARHDIVLHTLTNSLTTLQSQDHSRCGIDSCSSNCVASGSTMSSRSVTGSQRDIDTSTSNHDPSSRHPSVAGCNASSTSMDGWMASLIPLLLMLAGHLLNFISDSDDRRGRLHCFHLISFPTHNRSMDRVFVWSVARSSYRLRSGISAEIAPSCAVHAHVRHVVHFNSCGARRQTTITAVLCSNRSTWPAA